MKFAFKSIVVAAAFVAAGAANAALVTLSGDQVTGTGALTFSSALTSALNTGTVAVSAYGGADADITLRADGTYQTVTVGAQISSITYDDVTNQVISVQTAGGARQDAIFKAGVSNGGWVEVGNLDVNLQTKEIFGTVVGQSLAGVNVNWSGKLFTIGTLAGDTVFQEGTALTQINTLALTTAGFAEIKKALDLQFLGDISLQAASADFGNINSSLTVTAVPEPSTYALMGLGLVGIGFAARRRAAK